MYFLLDNRSPCNSSYDLTASAAHYHRLNCQFIIKYLIQSSIHSSWVRILRGIAVAGSPEKTKFISTEFIDPTKLDTIVESKFINNANQSSWVKYLEDGVSKITESILKSKEFECQNYIVIVTNDHALHLNASDSDLLQAQIKKLVEPIRNIAAATTTNDLRLRVICVSLQADDNSYLNHSHIFHHALQQSDLPKYCSFHYSTIVNTFLHYDVELRSVISSLSPMLPCTLRLPMINNIRLSVTFELHAATLRSADAMHNGLRSADPHSIVSRSGISPEFVDGFSLIVRPHRFRSPIFPSRYSFLKNTKAYHSLKSLLSWENMILVVKVPVNALVDQFYALVPPTEDCQEENAPMVMIRLVDGESFLTFDDYVPQTLDTSRGKGLHLNDGSDGTMTEKNNVMDVNNDSDPEEEQEIHTYLRSALINTGLGPGSLGPLADYNPSGCPSGKLNFLFEIRPSIGASTASLKQHSNYASFYQSSTNISVQGGPPFSYLSLTSQSRNPAAQHPKNASALSSTCYPLLPVSQSRHHTASDSSTLAIDHSIQPTAATNIILGKRSAYDLDDEDLDEDDVQLLPVSLKARAAVNCAGSGNTYNTKAVSTMGATYSAQAQMQKQAIAQSQVRRQPTANKRLGRRDKDFQFQL